MKLNNQSCYLPQLQSIAWTGLSIAGALVYLDVIPIEPYTHPDDFFGVTLVKLYFEGPNSAINGSYLGNFTKDYRNPKVIDLFPPDKMFVVLVSYAIIGVLYFFLSGLLYSNRNSKKPEEKRRFLDIALGWSCITFLFCVIDATLTYFLFRDFLQLKDYLNDPNHVISKGDPPCECIRDMTYIPLVLAFVSGRIVVLWIWNLVVACLFLVNALCCRKGHKKSFQYQKEDKKEQKVTAQHKTPPAPPPVELINKSYSTHTAKEDDRRSMEAVTSFSENRGNSQAVQVYSSREWNLANSETWNPEPFTRWDAINETFESDDVGCIVLEEAQNSHQDATPTQENIKIKQPPIGKPVSIPIPPPFTE